jgi:regulator of sigma D
MDMATDTVMSHLVQEAPPSRRSLASYFPSDLLVRIIQHFHAYGQLREDGKALSRRLVATNTVYDLPAAKAIEQRLAAWADGADALRAEAKASGEADDLRSLTAELREQAFDVRSVLAIPVERAAAIKERIAGEGLTGSTTLDELLRERLRDRS